MKIKFPKANYVLLAILIIAAFFRLYHYSDRIGFGQDSARDAIIGLFSIRNHKLPLMGPPSSAWGFNFGPLYYYFIALFTLIIPGIFSPWIGFTLLSLLTVFLVYKTGEGAFDKTFGFIAAFLCAISFAEVGNAQTLLNTVLVSFATALAFFALERTLNTKLKIFPILLGFSVALAINSHLQALSLLLLLPLTILFTPGKLKEKIINIIFISLGFLIGFVPLIIFEFQHNLAWTKSIIDYSLHGQQKFYTPVRWLTEFTKFWPSTFGQILSGIPLTGYLYSGLIVVSLVFSYLKKIRLPKIFYIIFTTFILEIISVRFYKGPRSPEYFIIAQQFVIFFVAFSLWVSLKINRWLGIVILLSIATMSIKSDLSLVGSKSNAPDILGLFAQEQKYLGNNQTTLYGTANSFGASIAIYYLSYKENLIGNGDSLIICDNLEGSAMGKPDFCPATGRLFNSGRLVIFPFDKLSPSQRIDYKTEELKAEIYYYRTYNNYELIKY